MKETSHVDAGDIIVLSGVSDVSIGDTICTKEEIKALERISVDEPTVSMLFSKNISPFAGHDGKAVYLSKGSAVEYAFNGNRNDSLTVSVHLVPTHAVENGRLRFSVSIDDEKPLVFDYETEEFSPEWKDNILRAQAVKTATFRYKKTNGCIRIIALDEGIVIDQVELK